MLAVELLTRVGLGTVLGLAIGIERQWRSRMAGLQTMALVSMGSALFVILSAYSFSDGDRLRVAAQIVSGIGFLGAGVIMKQGSSVTGLNTAATLWATAAVGALAGAWLWREAVAGAAIVLATNGFLQPLAARMDRLQHRVARDTTATDYVIEVICSDDAVAGIKAQIVESLTRPGFRLKSLRSVGTRTPAEAQVRAEVSSTGRDDDVFENAVRVFSAEPAVTGVSWAISP